MAQKQQHKLLLEWKIKVCLLPPALLLSSPLLLYFLLPSPQLSSSRPLCASRPLLPRSILVSLSSFHLSLVLPSITSPPVDDIQQRLEEQNENMQQQDETIQRKDREID
eukprot:169804-Hanusia_phi.AAC.1